MSPAEVELEFDAAIAKVEDERHRDMTLAWSVNRLWQLAWNGQLPTLPELLNGEKVSTDDRHKGKKFAAALHVFQARYGGTITYGRPSVAHG